MLKARIGVRDILIEVEADTKLKLEDALEAALNVAMRVNIVPQKAYREPETPGTPSIVRESPPTSVGGDKPQTIEEPVGIRGLSYDGADYIADYARIALDDMGKLYGTDRSYATQDIHDHLRKTGGDVLIKDNARPTSSLRQALKNSPYFVRKDGFTRLKEWIEEDETKTESHSEEPVKASESSEFDF